MTIFIQWLADSLAVVWILIAFYGPFKPWMGRILMRRQRKRLAVAAAGCGKQAVVLIIAVKGVVSTFDQFLDWVLAQSYPDYRVIFVTETAEDPAHQAIQQHLDLGEGEESWRGQAGQSGAKEVELVVAGLTENEGQKVHNQLAAFHRLRHEDQIVAFADADIISDENWLGRLVTPLNVGETAFATGYRWFFPTSQRFSNLVATNINNSVAMLAGPSWPTLLWGGSMAMTREVFDKLEVPKAVAGSVNDDLQMSRLALDAGQKVFYVRSLMVTTWVDYSWGDLLAFGCRQYFQVRTYVPLYWWLALMFTTLWITAWATTWMRLYLGDLDALRTLCIVYALELLKLPLRGHFLRELFGPGEVRKLRMARVVEPFTTTLNMMVHWYIIFSAMRVQDIAWTGIRYRVTGRQSTEVLERW